MAEALNLETAETIDVHAHVVLEETMGAAGKYGPTLSHDEVPLFRVGTYELHGVRYRGSAFMDANLRLQRMEEAGIDYQMLSPNPLTYFHFIEADAAKAFCRVHNDALERHIAPYPNLGAAAALPMQDVGFAIEEIQRAVGDLGMVAAYIGTDFGRPLDDPEMDAFYETLVALDIPLFIHPAPAGIDGPAGDPNLTRFDLDIIAGFCAQETLAVATLIYGGVLERHPQLDVCLSHGGGATAMLYGRMSAAAQKRPWTREALRQDGAFDELLHRLWFDVHLHSDASVALLKERVNPQQLVFGTNFAGWDQQSYNVRTEARAYADPTRKLLRAR